MKNINENLKISILLPIKECDINRLESCVNSILGQSYENFEIIIKYNGKDEDFEKIKKLFYDERIVLINTNDNSITDAANQAMKLSSGDIITLFAHDDFYKNNAFSTLINSVDDSKWYFGEINYYDVNNKLINTYYKNNPTIEDMVHNNMIPQPACFWKREVFEEIGRFDESFMLCWDYDYWIRIMEKWKPKFIPFKFANYYLNNNSISIKYPERMEIEKKMIFNKHFSDE